MTQRGCGCECGSAVAALVVADLELFQDTRPPNTQRNWGLVGSSSVFDILGDYDLGSARSRACRLERFGQGVETQCINHTQKVAFFTRSIW